MKSLAIGSDVEIARSISLDFQQTYGQVVYAEGDFWYYDKTQWNSISDHELRRIVHAYDGAEFSRTAKVKLGKSRIDSIINELVALLIEPNFFTQRTVGINSVSGFIKFDNDGLPYLIGHSPDHRCRHTLSGKWNGDVSFFPPKESLLFKFLDGIFRGDEDNASKVDLLAEGIGSAALGYGTCLRRPRAIILKGESAENGKSQVLDLARGMLPPSAVCSVAATRMGDERHITGLAGKLLNAVDELSSASAIASDVFKAIITGEPVEGRDVYKPRIEFRSQAQHIFATNMLPVFTGGMDRGVQRRVLVITFNRVILEGEIIENIGRRIAVEEPDLLLSWAVGGVSRLIQQSGFTVPPSSKEALNEWLYGSDPVMAWSYERVSVEKIVDNNPRISTADAYKEFCIWAMNEGFDERKLPAVNTFVQRVKANVKGIEHRRWSYGRFFLGMKIKLNDITGRRSDSLSS